MRSKAAEAASTSNDPVRYQGQPVLCGIPVSFAGYVDDFTQQIAGIQFSLDEGENWTDYSVEGASRESGISWQFSFTPTKPGWHCLQVRTVDDQGTGSSLVSAMPFLVVEQERPSSGQDPAFAHDHQPGSNHAYDHQLAPTSAHDHQLGPAAPAHTPDASRIRIRPLASGSDGSARIFRSGGLALATEADACRIRQLGIRTVYDIRTQRETAQSPDPLIAGICTIALVPARVGRRKDASKRLVAGVIGEYGAPEERMRANYRRYVEEYPLIGKALRSMADLRTPCLIHCQNGKDRTGVICAVLQRIAHVPDELIYEDYLRYNSINADAIQREAEQLGAGMTATERRILMSFLEARSSYIDVFFQEIDRRFGTFDTYVSQSLRLSVSQRQALEALVRGLR